VRALLEAGADVLQLCDDGGAPLSKSQIVIEL
jgi:hypothetical protein